MSNWQTETLVAEEMDTNKVPPDYPSALVEIGRLREQLNQYVGVTSAVFSRGILEDFLKQHLRSYISQYTADGIEAGYVQFLGDNNNPESVRMNAIIQNRMTRVEFARNCKLAYSKLSKIVHAASSAFRSLHASSMFINVLLQVPRLTDNEKLSVEIASELL